MPKEVLVFSPWNTHWSIPSSWTTRGASSAHLFGTWCSYMCGGSIMWSSIETRIMSSMFIAGPPPGSSRRPDRQRLPAAHRGRAGALGLVVVDLPLREPRQDLVQSDASLEPGERGAEAEMDPVAEGLMTADVAVDVEAVAVGKVALVPVGRPVQHHH